MKQAKCTLITVAVGETGEYREFRDKANNHRITVVRMDTGHVGLAFTPLRDRDDYANRRLEVRVEPVTPYPFAGNLPSFAAAHAMWMQTKRD